MKVLID